MNRRLALTAGLAAIGAMALARSALAQPKFPERPIRLVIPFPPGGVNDAVGRPWAERVKSSLGTVVVENQGGAGGSLGAAAVARAQPDGHTLLLGGSGAMVINPIAATRLSYDPLRDFDAVSLLALTAFAIVVHPSLPVRNLRELIDYARAHPGKLSYGTAGVGSGTHLTGELFKSIAGAADIVHVPYKGAGPAIADLIGGQIPMATPNVTGQILDLNRSGKLRILAVTTQARLVSAREVPTAIEAGLPGMIAANFVGLFAPAGTPGAVIERISQATRVAMSDAAFRQLLTASGLEPQPESTPEKTRRFLEDEIARWTPVIRSIGLKLE